MNSRALFLFVPLHYNLSRSCKGKADGKNQESLFPELKAAKQDVKKQPSKDSPTMAWYTRWGSLFTGRRQLWQKN
jgi:hypothetical protein